MTGSDVSSFAVPVGFDQCHVVGGVLERLAHRFQRHGVLAGELLGRIRVGAVDRFVDDGGAVCGDPLRRAGDSWSRDALPGAGIG